MSLKQLKEVFERCGMHNNWDLVRLFSVDESAAIINHVPYSELNRKGHGTYLLWPRKGNKARYQGMGDYYAAVKALQKHSGIEAWAKSPFGGYVPKSLLDRAKEHLT